ncbi:hypothetical protein F4774DRAFT_402639 [Daldinia eschscholtzii]|nr:hypothetical protein F4774DRAFT_402639 [Daldinia eschscholtzii]
METLRLQELGFVECFVLALLIVVVLPWLMYLAVYLAWLVVGFVVFVLILILI